MVEAPLVEHHGELLQVGLWAHTHGMGRRLVKKTSLCFSRSKKVGHRLCSYLYSHDGLGHKMSHNAEAYGRVTSRLQPFRRYPGVAIVMYRV